MFHGKYMATYMFNRSMTTYIFTGVGVLNIDCNSDLEQMAEGGAATQIQRGKGDAAGCWENGTCSTHGRRQAASSHETATARVDGGAGVGRSVGVGVQGVVGEGVAAAWSRCAGMGSRTRRCSAVT